VRQKSSIFICDRIDFFDTVENGCQVPSELGRQGFHEVGFMGVARLL